MLIRFPDITQQKSAKKNKVVESKEKHFDQTT